MEGNGFGITIKKVAYHRNGVGGEGFHVVAFDCIEDGVSRPMVGVVFPAHGRVAVFDTDMLAKGIIGMFEEYGNAWRGDMYEPYLREAIEKATAKKEVL